MATDPTFAEAVAQTVDDAIKAAGRSPQDVADAVGIAPRTFYRLLRNQNRGRSFQVNELDLIAHAIGAPVRSLIPTAE